MRVFYDVEFVERGPQLPIQPISLGFVAEDDRELYVINEECLSNVLRHPWLSINVAPSLPILNDQRSDAHFVTSWDPEHSEYKHVYALDFLVQEVYKFLIEVPDLELWAYYSAYDHVVLCQLFGSMADLPPGIPMWSHELQQVIEMDNSVKLPSSPPIAHHALWDARWNRDAFIALEQSR